MKKRSAILLSVVMAVLLAACGGGSSNAGTAGKQGDAIKQADTGGNGNSEAGTDGESSGNGVEEQIPDGGPVYREGEFFLADTDLYSAAVSGYVADEDGFSVKLKIGNKAES